MLYSTCTWSVRIRPVSRSCKHYYQHSTAHNWLWFYRDSINTNSQTCSLIIKFLHREAQRVKVNQRISLQSRTFENELSAHYISFSGEISDFLILWSHATLRTRMEEREGDITRRISIERERYFLQTYTHKHIHTHTYAYTHKSLDQWILHYY